MIHDTGEPYPSGYQRKPLWVEAGVLTDMQPKNAVSSSMHSSFAALLANFGLTLSGCSLAFPIPRVERLEALLTDLLLSNQHDSLKALECPAQIIAKQCVGSLEQHA